MDSIAEALENVEHAFKQLEFAVKLLCYCEAGHIDKTKFDADITVLLDTENVGFSSGSFDSEQKIISASQINVAICFGVSANVLDAALTVAGLSRDPKQCDPSTDLRILVYMVRCAFAHNAAAPVWEVRGDFSRTLNLSIEGRALPFDMSALHGKEFDYKHIGELATWFKIKRAAVSMITGA